MTNKDKKFSILTQIVLCGKQILHPKMIRPQQKTEIEVE